MLQDAHGDEATPAARSVCPSCHGELIAHCGPIVTWHWAHKAADCDPWAEPESEWHRAWKRYMRDRHDARLEVPMGEHRADVMLPSGTIIELQAGYLSADDIAKREAFYGPQLQWVYRCHWGERIHWGRRGFWWKHGAKSMATHRRRIWWHLDDELLMVSLGVAEHETGRRVLGKVLQRHAAPSLVLEVAA